MRLREWPYEKPYDTRWDTELNAHRFTLVWWRRWLLDAAMKLAFFLVALAGTAAVMVVFIALLFFFMGLFFRLVEPAMPTVRCWIGTGPCGS